MLVTSHRNDAAAASPGRPKHEAVPASRLALLQCLSAHRRGVPVVALAIKLGLSERTVRYRLARARTLPEASLA